VKRYAEKARKQISKIEKNFRVKTHLAPCHHALSQ
jgi:hypothetical protein